MFSCKYMGQKRHGGAYGAGGRVPDLACFAGTFLCIKEKYVGRAKDGLLGQILERFDGITRQ